MYFMKIFIILTLLLAAFALKAEPFPVQNLDGHYTMDLVIQNKVFHDQFILSGLNGPIDMRTFGGPLAGSITVPGVFSAPLTGNGNCSLWGSFCNFNFSIVAKENGQEFNVFYKIQLSHQVYLDILTGKSPVTFEGDAFLDNQQPLGHFKAVRNE